ncbi:MAG: Tetracycline resistance protein, class C [Chlamydiae bacterium]|nr:Tetracycline resistance protein, class C [Chlamydiota bacterium]
MQLDGKKLSFTTILLSGFIDYAGMAMVFPLLTPLLFSPTSEFIAADASQLVRGIWLGVLLSIFPLMQFFFSPIFGALSDQRGRKGLLVGTLSLALVGYLIGVFSIAVTSLPLLVASRICVGIAGGNCSIVSAVVADLSTSENKAKNYGLLNMAFGGGFTLGPFLGGILAHRFGLVAAFSMAFFFVALNLILVAWKFQETFYPSKWERKVGLFQAISHLKIAAKSISLRFVFLTLLLSAFGWAFFTEFVPLFFYDQYGFSTGQIGMTFGYMGLIFSLSSGFLIDPIIRKWGISISLFFSLLCSGFSLLLLLFVEATYVLLLLLPISQFFLSFIFPSLTSIISNKASEQKQGEALGIYQSVIALALALTPLFSGGYIGSHPTYSVVVGGCFMILAAVVFAAFQIFPSRVRS